MFDALKDKQGTKIIGIIWAGANPVTKIADLKPERFGIALAPGGNMPAGDEDLEGPGRRRGAIYYYYAFPKNKMNDWLVPSTASASRRAARLLHAGGMAAGVAVGRGHQEGRRHRHREADRGDGRHELRSRPRAR
jgi:branched-chain amino acid transport system substrate-binding protein